MPKLEFSAPFCTHLNRVAEEFPSGLERDFAQHFSVNFLEFWKQALGSTPSASTPTYSSVAATATAAAIATVSPIRSSTTSSVYPPPLPTATHRQGQRAPPPPPPREDLRVFVRLDADAPARNHIGYAIRAHVASKTGLELNKAPQVVQVNTGWAIRAVDKTTRDLLLERQAEWADDLGASAGQASQKWHTYAVNNCPRRLTDLYGNEIDYDTAVRDEINHQTGLTPVSIRTPRRDNERLPYKTLIISFLQPTKRPCSLFGTSRPARLIENNNPPKQCDNCWDFHTRHACNRQTRCKHCGKTGHTSEGCGAAEQCANCLGPHTAELANCPARPKKTDGLPALPTTPGGTAATAIAGDTQRTHRNRTSHRTTARSGGSHGIASESRQPFGPDQSLGLHLASSTDDIPDATQDPETGTRDSISATSADFT
ncbi:Zinc finger, CCHC-type, partial [Metarhizium hybridum]